MSLLSALSLRTPSVARAAVSSRAQCAGLPRAARVVAPLRKMTVVRAAETEENVDVDMCDENIGEYCTIDGQAKKVSGRSVEDMEALYKQQMEAYSEGKPILTEEEFENLRDELLWQGSDVPLKEDDCAFSEDGSCNSKLWEETPKE